MTQIRRWVEACPPLTSHLEFHPWFGLIRLFIQHPLRILNHTSSNPQQCARLDYIHHNWSRMLFASSINLFIVTLNNSKRGINYWWSWKIIRTILLGKGLQTPSIPSSEFCFVLHGKVFKNLYKIWNLINTWGRRKRSYNSLSKVVGQSAFY